MYYSVHVCGSYGVGLFGFLFRVWVRVLCVSFMFRFILLEERWRCGDL